MTILNSLDKFQKCLHHLKRKGYLEQQIYDRIRPSAAELNSPWAAKNS